MAVAIQTIPNYIRDLIRILNKFSIKIYLYLDGHGAKRRLAMTILVAIQQSPLQLGMTSEIFVKNTLSNLPLYPFHK
ncbi:MULTISPECIES: hypothetical protein [unclassified Rickettsia]|uniref:hypothetical protein n=1 Tax=unclassified Rickettsia TaxID=114295 RepID=UPI00313337A9